MPLIAFLIACEGPVPGAIDADADGFAARDDCDDGDADVHPGAPEVGGDGADHDCDGRIPPSPSIFSGRQADEGFGTRVLLASGDAIAAAPFSAEGSAGFGGRIYRGDTVLLRGRPEARLGASLALLIDGTVIVGAPGAGQIRTLDGAVLAEQAGIGAILAANGGDWVASTPTGARTSAGLALAFDAVPDALALTADGTVIAGFARGDVAVRIVGGSRGDVAIARAAPGDEAGASLALDGDGTLLVGAPGSGAVYAIDLADPPASLADAPSAVLGGGRFGAAIAVHERGVLFVGAPMAGGEVEGAVFRVDAMGAPSLAWEGDTAGEQLGFSLSAADDAVIAGAPGAAASAGRAWVRVP